MVQTVYLDTAIWMDLAQGSGPSDEFERCVRDGKVIPVLSFIHILEFANTSAEYRHLYGEYLNHVCSLTHVRWIRGLGALCRDEVVNAFLKWCGGSPHSFPAFTDNLVDALQVKMTYLNALRAKAYSLSKVIEMVSTMDEFKDHKVFRDSVPAARRAIRTSRKTRLRFKKHEKTQWIAAYLPTSVETKSGITLSVTPDMVQGFIKACKFSELPAVWLRIMYHEGANLMSGGESPSDVEDLMHLIGSAYCDVAFADKRTVDALQKTNVPKLPLRNTEFPDWLQSL